MSADIEYLEDWLGRTALAEADVTERLLAQYRAVLRPHLFERQDSLDCPPGLHWGIAPRIPAARDVGADGAEAAGRFLPPISLQRRMWAGGALEFFAPIRIGTRVERRSVLARIEMKQGRAGPLCFMSIEHEFRSQGVLLLRERQDLVFHNGISAKPNPDPYPCPRDLNWQIEASPLLLFCFSAFSFNAHRIHYDADFAKTEGYDAPIVQGPLQAALLLNQAAVLKSRVPKRFTYRCLAPLESGDHFTVSSGNTSDGISGTIIRSDGTACCRAEASF